MSKSIEDKIIAFAKRYIYLGPLLFVTVCLSLLGWVNALIFFIIGGILFWIGDSI